MKKFSAFVGGYRTDAYINPRDVSSALAYADIDEKGQAVHATEVHMRDGLTLFVKMPPDAFMHELAITNESSLVMKLRAALAELQAAVREVVVRDPVYPSAGYNRLVDADNQATKALEGKWHYE